MSRKPKPIVSHLSGAPQHASTAEVLRAWGKGGKAQTCAEFPYLRAVLGPSFTEADLLNYLGERARV